MLREGIKHLSSRSGTSSGLDRAHLKKAGLDFLRLDGSTRNRGEIIDTFQSEEGPPVLLLSSKRRIWTPLTEADRLHDGSMVEPAVEDQAADRAHRIGQSRPVLSTESLQRTL